MKILAINTGSSSVRLHAYDFSSGSPQSLWSRRLATSDPRPQNLLEQVLGLQPSTTFDAAVHRLVHGGSDILQVTIVDEKIKSTIDTLVPLAPLHNSACLIWLRAAETVLGPKTQQMVIPDTGYFADLPERARRYAIPLAVSERLGIRRFGFHGLAHEWMVRRWHELATPREPEGTKLISLQLGSGCSITAIKGGRPVDTSMGYTPLEGLVMATRSGDVDAGILLRLLGDGSDADALSHVLNHESGLRGLSGLSGDMQQLLSSPTPDASTAIDIYCYRARKYLGAFMAALGGVDAILFGGGVGENSPEIRARILEGMSWCGIEIDDRCNQRFDSGTRMISKDGAGIAIWVIEVDEERLMAEAAQIMLTGGNASTFNDDNA
jgi:acetate kinase